MPEMGSAVPEPRDETAVELAQLLARVGTQTLYSRSLIDGYKRNEYAEAIIDRVPALLAERDGLTRQLEEARQEVEATADEARNYVTALVGRLAALLPLLSGERYELLASALADDEGYGPCRHGFIDWRFCDKEDCEDAQLRPRRALGGSPGNPAKEATTDE